MEFVFAADAPTFVVSLLGEVIRFAYCIFRLSHRAREPIDERESDLWENKKGSFEV
jgi:hypothetical protein